MARTHWEQTLGDKCVLMEEDKPKREKERERREREKEREYITTQHQSHTVFSGG